MRAICSGRGGIVVVVVVAAAKEEEVEDGPRKA